LDQARVTQVLTPEPKLLATLELPLAGRSFSTDSRGAALEKMQIGGDSWITLNLFTGVSTVQIYLIVPTFAFRYISTNFERWNKMEHEQPN
jgi:hypothetical protein